MEHKIGEIITLPDGRTAEVVEGSDCGRCALNEYICHLFVCTKKLRTDGKGIIYKEIKED